MKIFLLLIPFFTTIFGILAYALQKKDRELFKLDLTQFIYLFLIAPTFFVWAKSFIFFILRSELNLGLSITDLFVVDTVFSVLGFIIIIAIAMHSLTKTFRLKRDRDPDFDLFRLSEYFHLWWTHIVLWVGSMLVITFISVVNILVPLEITTMSQMPFYLSLVIGLFSGLMLFFAVWNSDAKQGNYMRLMKLFFAFFFVVHVVIYFLLDPSFDMSYGGYWVAFAIFTASVFASSTFERYDKPRSWKEKLQHFNWGNNINLFPSSKKKKGFIKSINKKRK